MSILDVRGNVDLYDTRIAVAGTKTRYAVQGVNGETGLLHVLWKH